MFFGVSILLVLILVLDLRPQRLPGTGALYTAWITNLTDAAGYLGPPPTRPHGVSGLHRQLDDFLIADGMAAGFNLGSMGPGQDAGVTNFLGVVTRIDTGLQVIWGRVLDEHGQRQAKDAAAITRFLRTRVLAGLPRVVQVDAQTNRLLPRLGVVRRRVEREARHFDPGFHD